MAFFSEGQNRVKLLILYIIKCFRTPVTREQIFTVFSAADGTDYFTVCELAAELEKEQYMLSVPVKNQQLLYLTEKGVSLTDTFEHEIARSVRDEVKGLADESRDEVRRRNCVTADAAQKPDGSWVMDFSLIEKDSVVFEMTLRFPDAASAAKAERKWLGNADGIYLDVLRELTE